MEELTNNQLSEFNSNVASLRRIDFLIQRVHDAILSDDFDVFFKTLKSLRTEARYKMKHKIKDDKCIEGCPRCKCDEDFNVLKKIALSWKNNDNNKVLKLRLEIKIDEFSDFLMDFMGEKGMLLRDATDEATYALR